MNYYNENDPKAAAWLRELIKEKLIPNGHIDTRSIRDVSGSDLDGFCQCHFFSGIGGWSHALRLAGWPEDKPVWTGSCPCQPFSCAGKGLGEDDERHLWPDFARLIRAKNPPIVFGEQVASAAGREWLAGVFADLEGMGYQRAAADLCAASSGAPHIRQRLYWMAHSDNGRWQSGNSEARSREAAILAGQSGEVFGGLVQPDSAGRLARKPSAEAERYGRSVEPTGRVGWMGEPIQPGLEGQPGNGDDGNKPGRNGEEPHGPVAAAGAVGGVDVTSGEQEQSCAKERLHAESSSRGAWSDFDVIPCRDGKSRRIESGSQPLAHGVSGRVGLLRGYGNAIVPQLAAQFVQAAQEAMNQQAEMFGVESNRMSEGEGSLAVAQSQKSS